MTPNSRRGATDCGYGSRNTLGKSERRSFAGRVQSVALRLVVEREREIQAFIPKEYWLLAAVFSPENSTKSYHARLVKIDGQDYLLPDEAAALTAVEALREAAYRLESLKTTQRGVNPAAPFITSTLQQDASRKLGFPSRKTMQIAQQLYEGIDIGNAGGNGLITLQCVRLPFRLPHRLSGGARVYPEKLRRELYLPAKPPFYKTRAASPGSARSHQTNTQR